MQSFIQITIIRVQHNTFPDWMLFLHVAGTTTSKHWRHFLL